MTALHCYILGSGTDADIRVDGVGVEERHARILEERPGEWIIEDLACAATTTLNGKSIGRANLTDGDEIGLSGTTLEWPAFISNIDGMALVERKLLGIRTTSVRSAKENLQKYPGEIWIGTGIECDLRIKNPGVEKRQARLFPQAGEWVIEDLAMRETTLLNGSPIGRSTLKSGDIITFGTSSYRWPINAIMTGISNGSQSDSRSISAAPIYDELVFHSVAIANYSKNREPMPVQVSGVSVNFKPGTITAILGPSGIGKSTMFNGLLNRAAIVDGSVSFLNQEVRSMGRLPASWISLVPQSVDLPLELTVEDFLLYVCAVRNARSMQKIERLELVNSTAASLQIEDKLKTSLRDLSGGQLRRVSIAAEMLSQPKILLLDEPSSGLDEGLDRQLLNLLRKIAKVSATIVIVITHSVANLDLCDTVVLLGENTARRSGMAGVSTVRYFGPPDELLPSMTCRDYASVFDEMRIKGKQEPLRIRVPTASFGDRGSLLKRQPSVWYVSRRIIQGRYASLVALVRAGSDRTGSLYQRTSIWMAFCLRGVSPFFLFALCVGILTFVGDGYGGQESPNPAPNPSVLKLLQMQLTIIGFFAMRRPLIAITDSWAFSSREKLWGLDPARSIMAIAIVDTPWLVLFGPGTVIVTSFTEEFRGEWAIKNTLLFYLVIVAFVFELSCYALGVLISVLFVRREYALEVLVFVMVAMTVFTGYIVELREGTFWSLFAEIVPTRQFMVVAASLLDAGSLTDMPVELIDPHFSLASDEMISRVLVMLAGAGILFMLASGFTPISLNRYEKGRH